MCTLPLSYEPGGGPGGFGETLAWGALFSSIGSGGRVGQSAWSYLLLFNGSTST
jgi:hypothetical protein